MNNITDQISIDQNLVYRPNKVTFLTCLKRLHTHIAILSVGELSPLLKEEVLYLNLQREITTKGR